jgi:hypothetical protein
MSAAGQTRPCGHVGSNVRFARERTLAGRFMNARLVETPRLAGAEATAPFSVRSVVAAPIAARRRKGTEANSPCHDDTLGRARRSGEREVSVAPA